MSNALCKGCGNISDVASREDYDLSFTGFRVFFFFSLFLSDELFRWDVTAVTASAAAGGMRFGWGCCRAPSPGTTARPRAGNPSGGAAAAFGPGWAWAKPSGPDPGGQKQGWELLELRQQRPGLGKATENVSSSNKQGSQRGMITRGLSPTPHCTLGLGMVQGIWGQLVPLIPARLGAQREVSMWDGAERGLGPAAI